MEARLSKIDMGNHSSLKKRRQSGGTKAGSTSKDNAKNKNKKKKICQSGGTKAVCTGKDNTKTMNKNATPKKSSLIHENKMTEFEVSSSDSDVVLSNLITKCTKREAVAKEFTLRVGDVIRCEHIRDVGTFADVTVTEIIPGNSIHDGLYVWTDNPLYYLGPWHRLQFRLVSSIHNDAPPSGETWELDDVNLEEGSAQEPLEQKKSNVQKLAEYHTGGVETMALVTAVERSRKAMSSDSAGAVSLKRTVGEDVNNKPTRKSKRSRRPTEKATRQK